MLMKLLCGIIIGLLNNIDVKQSNIDKYWSYTSLISPQVVNNSSPRTMPKPHTIIQYSREKLLDYRFGHSYSKTPNRETLSKLKEHNLLKYRGKRAGRLRIKSNAGVNFENLIQIQPDHTLLLNAQRQKQLKLSTVNTRSLRGKSADLLQHVFDENMDLCFITETWLQADGDKCCERGIVP